MLFKPPNLQYSVIAACAEIHLCPESLESFFLLLEQKRDISFQQTRYSKEYLDIPKQIDSEIFFFFSSMYLNWDMVQSVPFFALSVERQGKLSQTEKE